MADAIDHGERAPDRSAAARWVAEAANAARAAGPPLLFGLRLWASVCLALYVAFWLELPNAQWAGTSAAIVCQPHLVCRLLLEKKKQNKISSDSIIMTSTLIILIKF